LEIVRLLAAAHAEAPAHEGMSRPGSNLYPLRWDDRIVAVILGCQGRLDRLRAAIGVRRLCWLSAYISWKPPGSSELAWHQDWWCWDDPVSLRRLAPQVAILCYLTGCERDSGALRMLPGSHARSTDLHASLPEPHSAAAHSLASDHAAFADHEDQVTARVAGGDAVLIDYRLLHGTHRNDTARRRDCVLMSFLPDPDLLPSHIRSHLAVHPALPTPEEWSNAAAAGYGAHIARFGEEPKSLRINRVPPATFSDSNKATGED
jgi:ectoine hydroxylase-related dioxygenase (phytanoyl-CoA dioxygenase family)